MGTVRALAHTWIHDGVPGSCHLSLSLCRPPSPPTGRASQSIWIWCHPSGGRCPPEPVGHANGAIVPAEGAAIVAARANHLAAHSASTVEGVAAAIKAVHAPQLALNNLNLVGHANGAIVPAEGAAIVAARANHLAAHSASTVEGVAAAINAAHAPQLALNNLNLVGHAN